MFWCTNHPNVHILTFWKLWSFLWGSFFPVTLRKKCPSTDFFSASHFAVFELNTEIYGVNLRIQPKYRKIWTRKKLLIWTLSRSTSIFKCSIFKESCINLFRIPLTQKNTKLLNLITIHCVVDAYCKHIFNLQFIFL